jgi:hypothetical protein
LLQCSLQTSTCTSMQKGLKLGTKKLSLWQVVKAYRVVRRWGSHIFQKIGSQCLSALRTGQPLPQEDSWCSFLLEAESTPGP